MLFNSHVFLFLFLPVVLAAWYAPWGSQRARVAVLGLASFVFYGYWNWRYVPLMLGSVALNYVCGSSLHSAPTPRGRRAWLVAAVAGNLALLGVFKYTGFLARTANQVAGTFLGTADLLPVPDIVLPIGISFYTFHCISYVGDVYRRKTEPAPCFTDFATYVSLFPQLIAGPIVRWVEVSATVLNPPRRLTWERAEEGLRFFVLGLAKKLLLADLLAPRVDQLLASPEGLTLTTSWLAMLGYTLQIYFDFSAYSDMAIGLGRLLGFSFPQNFASPYKSASITEFWRRWHMTLSSWLRDYLYIPLGGNRFGQLLTVRNLALTMFLGGLWHGAAWTFVLWGLYHGALLIGHHLWRSHTRVRLPHALGVAATLLAVLLGWVLFRATDLRAAGAILSALAGLHGLGLLALPGLTALAALVVGGLVICLAAPSAWELRPLTTRRQALLYAALFVASLLQLGAESPFLYFQF